MGLFRLLFIALAIGIIVILIRRLLTTKSQQSEQSPAAYNPMVRCAHCGAHLPRDHAIRSKDGHYYCSIEHRDANQR